MPHQRHLPFICLLSMCLALIACGGTHQRAKRIPERPVKITEAVQAVTEFRLARIEQVSGNYRNTRAYQQISTPTAMRIRLHSSSILVPYEAMRSLVPPVYSDLADPRSPELEVIGGTAYVPFRRLERISLEGEHTWRAIPPRRSQALAGRWALAFGSVPSSDPFDPYFESQRMADKQGEELVRPGYATHRLWLTWHKPGAPESQFTLFVFEKDR